MPALVPKGNPDGPRLEVADDQVEFWSGVGYVLADGGSAPKKTAKKTASKSSAKK